VTDFFFDRSLSRKISGLGHGLGLGLDNHFDAKKLWKKKQKSRKIYAYLTTKELFYEKANYNYNFIYIFISFCGYSN
jgi:hypothetical protein